MHWKYIGQGLASVGCVPCFPWVYPFLSVLGGRYCDLTSTKKEKVLFLEGKEFTKCR